MKLNEKDAQLPVEEMDPEEQRKEHKEKLWEPKIIGFLCNWCSYAGADLTGSSRIQYPPNIRIIRVPCSGRVDPQLVIKALRLGADGVLVSGCHPGDCHYTEGNYYNRRRMAVLKSLLTFLGIHPKRFQATWVSASEAVEFAQIVENMTQELRELGPQKNFLKEWKND